MFSSAYNKTLLYLSRPGLSRGKPYEFFQLPYLKTQLMAFSWGEGKREQSKVCFPSFPVIGWKVTDGLYLMLEIANRKTGSGEYDIFR